MLRYLFIILLFLVNSFSFTISSNDDYKVYQTKNYTIIYTNDYQNEAKFIKDNIDKFIKTNDKSFGYSFDEPLKIVLVSNNVQIANAFSTQIPFNMDVYYNGGSAMDDYFSNSSWLMTLFTHEMIHNYQTNAKKSKISKTLHRYLGNNYMPVFAVLPFFTLPNILLPTAFLEGDAVLNESQYNNGGRLYSGRFNALKNSLIFHNKITPNRFLNDHLSFPFTQEKYIIGGYYMQYMAKKFGIDKVNQFFYQHSIHSINPFMLDTTFIKHFGITFSQSLYEFIYYTKIQNRGYKELSSDNILASSLGEVYLSKIDNKIYFITTNLTTSKVLNIYDINSDKLIKKDTLLNNGKVYNIKENLYSFGAGFVSNRYYKYGLFDKDNYILKNTQGKAVQDIKGDKVAYIDLKSSFLNSKLFIDDKFYNTISSSAIFDDKQNIYYFKQDKNIRQLYKNKTLLFSFKGYYSKVVDIVDNSVYFIANSKNGSGLYRYKDDKIELLNNSDNIINSKIIDNSKALVVTVTSDNYNISLIKFNPVEVYDIPYNEYYHNDNGFRFDTKTTPQKLANLKYNEFKQLEFSLLYPTYTSSSSDGNIYMFNAIFTDPLMFNTLSLYGYKDTQDSIVGTNYTNERYIPFKIDIYSRKRTIKFPNQRDFGGELKLYDTVLKKGRNTIDVALTKYIDDENKDKSPISISFDYNYIEMFPLADDYHFKYTISSIYKEDRGDDIVGLEYSINKYLFGGIYANADIKTLQSDANVALREQRGVEVVKTQIDRLQNNTSILIEGLDNPFYTQDITKYSIGLSKSFNIQKYYEWFPISLRKENIFIQHNYFKLYTNYNFDITEDIFGIKFDTLFFHKLPIPVTLKYIKNDISKDDYKLLFTLGVEF